MQFGNRIGRYVVKICVTLAMACFFIVCSDGFTHCDGMILLAFFYFPCIGHKTKRIFDICKIR